MFFPHEFSLKSLTRCPRKKRHARGPFSELHRHVIFSLFLEANPDHADNVIELCRFRSVFFLFHLRGNKSKFFTNLCDNLRIDGSEHFFHFCKALCVAAFHADEESALADVVENGKVKAKDIEAKIVELTSTIETEETIELEVIRTDLQLVNTKKRLEAYLVGHPLCKSAVNENGKITKSSIEYRLRIIRTEECVPESLQDDVNQLKAALELCGKVSDYNKVVKDLNKALDEKCRTRYDRLTDEEILELLVNKKWFDSIFSGIADLYAAISHRLTNRIVELAERYENTLPELDKDTTEYEAKVKSHLERMGFKW